MDIKKEFFDYIGPANSLSGYVKSYKLVLLRNLLETMNSEGMAKVTSVAERFKEFYKDRKLRGLKPDVEVDSIIQNIETSSINKVISIIKANPFEAISRNGYLDIKVINGVEYLCFNIELYKQMTKGDWETLLEIIDRKIDYYFRTRVDNIGGTESNLNSLKAYFDKILNNYINARTAQVFANNPMGRLIRNDITSLISSFDFIDNSIYKVHGSCGQGSWATVPWIAILDKRITTTTQKGVYIVYLFSSDMKRLYLTLNQGCTSLIEQHGKKEAINVMLNLAENVRSKITDTKFITNNALDVGNEPYEQGCIFYKEYKAGEIPSDNILMNDLKDMVEVYKTYYEAFEKEKNVDEKEETKIPVDEGDDVEISIKEYIDRITNYIKNKGYTYDDDLIKNFYLALKSKPFVILAGTSGTGKSKLVKLFAEAVGATFENGRYKLVPVKPDWSDSTDLLGYRDLQGKFHPGLLTSFIKKAMNDIDNPYFICLDEMNLARVEYYFSDILSVMETRRWDRERIVTDKLISEELFGDDENARQEYKDIHIPENLYIIGTVNMDETTFPFSKKVLDRANTIEFSYVDFDMIFNEIREIESDEASNKTFKSEFLQLNDCSKHEETVNKVIFILKEINDKLFKVNLHFGYRIRDEICYYLIYNEKNNILEFNKAMDNEILQKILPRIQGSSMTIKRVLIDLFKICIGNQVENFNYDDSRINEDMFKYIEENENIPYKKSASKLAFMMRRFEEDGFTSYWL